MTSQGKEVACCMLFCIFVLYMCSSCGVKVRSLPVMIPRTLFALAFVKELPLMVTGIEGGGGNFSYHKR